jgi:hypothetical protein
MSNVKAYQSLHVQNRRNSNSGVQLGPLGTTATNRPTVPIPGDYGDGEFGGMTTARGNRCTWRKPAPSAILSTTNPTCSAREHKAYKY